MTDIVGKLWGFYHTLRLKTTAASGLEGDRLRAEIRKARSLASEPFGINIPIYRPNALEALEIAVEEGIKTRNKGASINL